jgi:hypothetical protein
MAGEWIKMRPSLLTSPKVNGIARILEGSQQVAKVLTTGFGGVMSEIVTRNVTRNVTVASLLVVWGAANEHTDDGVFRNADLSDIDDMVGIPGFGEAMELVGWAIYDEDNECVILPNFNEYNTCGKDRSAERQRRYRERKRRKEGGADSKSDVTRDVTRDVTQDVTGDGREEKRRIKNIRTHSGAGVNGKFQALAWLKAHGVEDKIAADWLKVRKAKRAANTLTAFEGLEREATKAGMTVAQAVAVAAERSWQGFKADWLEGQTAKPSGMPYV